MAWLAAVGPSAQKVMLHAAPMFHLADGALIIGGSLTGDAHAIIPSFTPEDVLAAVERFGVTDILLVPTMINMLVSHPKIADADVTSVRWVVYGGSAIPEAVLARHRRVPQLPLHASLWPDGAVPHCNALGPREFEGPNAGRLTSAGHPATCNELEIVDPNDTEVMRGTVGEIRCRGPNVMLGYWNKPAETAAALRDGWAYTGDAGYMDEEGLVYIVDRLKDMIVTGGENVYSAEVENAVCNHPAVAQCAVIAIPSEEWGEAVHTIVILKEGCDAAAEDIIAHCRQAIAHYNCPLSIEFRSEPFPLSGPARS